MIRRVAVVLLLVWPVLAAPASAQSFFQNFLKPEYLIPVAQFPAAQSGDLNVVYYQIQIPRVPNGELLILGELGVGRHVSITAYDDHGAVIDLLNDADIQPYVPSQPNPYIPGNPSGVQDVLYAVTVRMGQNLATNAIPACATPGSVHANVLDARTRHTGGTYYSGDQSGFSTVVPGYGTVTHDDTVSNDGVFLFIRTYLEDNAAPGGSFDLRKPWVWVRASGSGCAPQLAPTGTFLPLGSWFSLIDILDLAQTNAHVQHEQDLGFASPYGSEPNNEVEWFGTTEYVPGGAATRNLAGAVPFDEVLYPNAAAALNAESRVAQMQLRLPDLPCGPPPSCALTGSEELRYWSLSLSAANGTTLATLTDLDLEPDVDGYVTLVLSFGTPIPPHVTPANGYTAIVLPAIALEQMTVRQLLPEPTFDCSTANVPFRTNEHHSNQGYMGDYAPVVSFPVAADLPAVAVPLMQGGSCAP